MATPTLNPTVARAFENGHKEMDQKGIVGLEALKKQQLALFQEASDLMVAAEIIGHSIAIIERGDVTAMAHHEKNVMHAISSGLNQQLRPVVVPLHTDPVFSGYTNNSQELDTLYPDPPAAPIPMSAVYEG